MKPSIEKCFTCNIIVNPHSWYPVTRHSINITSIFNRTRTLYVPVVSLKIEGILFQELTIDIIYSNYED